MGLPGHRRTSSDKRKRSAHFGLKKVHASVCQKCKKSVLSHQACEFCGFYKGRSVKMKEVAMPKKVEKKVTAKA